MFYLVFATNSGYSIAEVPKVSLVIGLVLGLAVLVTFYLLRSIGIYKLAKKNGIEKPWIAFIPAVWMFTACKLIGDSSAFFGKTFTKIALLFGIAFSVCAAVSFIDKVLSYYPLLSYAVQAGNNARIYYVGSYSSDFFAASGIPVYPYDGAFCVDGFVSAYPAWLNGFMTALNVVGIITSLVSIVITVSVYFSLFRKFWPAHYVLASILSILLSLFPIFAFVIRNNEPLNYGEYMRDRYRRFYSDRYGRRPGGTDGTQPFDEFKTGNGTGGSTDDPFEEFSDKNSRDDGNAK